ncbi:MAG: DUF3179 domain-containing protein [Halobacteriaceae archaeon]
MARGLTRRTLLAGAGASALAGCLGSLSDPATDPTDDVPPAGPDIPPTREDRLPLPMAPAALREQAVSGGPPKDGIPSIDDPTFVPAAQATDHLAPADPVFGLAMAGSAKAYPQSILVWHEICNDTIADTPVSVTYCPLTGTAMGFKRGQTTFGVSGRLVNNNLIMYDRATETWWPQVLATAIPGPWHPDPPIRSLRAVRVTWTTWDRWHTDHPETQVLSRDTGYARNYDRDPYGSYNPRDGYYAPHAAPLFAPLNQDDRLPPKRVVIGARTTTAAIAIEKDTLRDTPIIDGTVGTTPIVAVYDPTLDTGYVYTNPDRHQFDHEDGQVIDETGARHAPDSLPLAQIPAFDAMWFAWSGFYPDTTLYA